MKMRCTIFTAATVLLAACGGKGAGASVTDAATSADTTVTTSPAADGSAFNADSAYSYVAAQVAFGPRVPGTAAHDACRDYLAASLEAFGADTVICQQGVVTAYDGTRLPITNIFAAYNPTAEKRILLAAHYDTRPWADMEPDQARRNEPIDGANDGASGVGVLLEVARALGAERPGVGVDILLVDAEDYGAAGGGADTWCLGTQYFVANMDPYKGRALPQYGILLDMVGGLDATFRIEEFSGRYARAAVSKVWGQAERLGLGEVFLNRPGGAAVDDHVFLTAAGIPTVDIIEIDNPQTGSFPPSWHTHADNMTNISVASLGNVGRVVLATIYNEKI